MDTEFDLRPRRVFKRAERWLRRRVVGCRGEFTSEAHSSVLVFFFTVACVPRSGSSNHPLPSAEAKTWGCSYPCGPRKFKLGSWCGLHRTGESRPTGGITTKGRGMLPESGEIVRVSDARLTTYMWLLGGDGVNRNRRLVGSLLGSRRFIRSLWRVI